MKLIPKIPFIGKKDKAPEPDQEIQVNITTKSKGKPTKTAKLTNTEPVLKPNVFKDESELEDSLIRGNGDKGGLFKEKRPQGGIQSRAQTHYDSDKLNAMLVLDIDDDKVPTLTVTPKDHFLVMVIGDTFDEILKLGENRDLESQSVWSIFRTKRDRRAPSAYPEPGDNRNAIMKAQEIMAQDNESGSFTNFGGGR